ncbi:hypothetical protein [Anaerobacillus arseniciselenatis]|uniref:hypothetical protein n=1 Tax=Anaerobacillus arseniciselenatis TaxID=85682 RepID=UPI0014720ACE|nr:hypothetical protein [Anaerobacillus arseniciselenatis]
MNKKMKQEQRNKREEELQHDVSAENKEFIARLMKIVEQHESRVLKQHEEESTKKK